MRAAVLALSALLILAYGPPTFAKETSAEAAAAAAQAAKDGKAGEAARGYARAARLAATDRDLEAEQVAADGLEDALGKVAAGAERQRALLEAAKELDAARAGALVAVRGLALRILFESTQSGDPTGVSETVTLLAGTSKVGAAGGTLAAYAAAKKLVVDGRAGDAAAALEKVADQAFDARFDDIAFYAGVEAAAARLATRDDRGAKEALSHAARVFGDGKDAWLQNAWRAISAKRFVDVAAEVTQPMTDALAGGTSASAAGGRGGRGGTGGSGGEDKSPFGSALKRAAPKKPLVWIERAKDGWRSRSAWETKPQTQPFEPGFPMLDREDGLFWIVAGRAHTVTLRKLDLTGLAGGPGESSEPPVARARWHLAEGETLALLPDGTIQVSK